MDLGPLLRAHGYLRVERPPELWEADVGDVALVRLLGEMIAAALVRGAALGDVVLRANNVTVEADDDAAAESGTPAPGDYVALTIIGDQGSWRPEVLWRPGTERTGREGPLLSEDLEAALRAARIPFAYNRSSGAGGSVTVFLPRAGWRRPPEPDG